MSGELGHWPMGLDANGNGPETDPDLIETVVCAWCDPVEEWPCEAYRAGGEDAPHALF